VNRRGWSLVVETPEQAAAALRAPGDALDLRAFAEPGPGWVELGFVPLDEEESCHEEQGSGASVVELVRPLPVVLATVEDTRALGARLAAVLVAGDLVLLSGPLGAGKTALTQGIGAGLGVRGRVTSPTFVLSRRHRGEPDLVHVDAYRLASQDAEGAGDSTALDLEDLDLDLDLAVTVVEWGEQVERALPGPRLLVTLSRGETDAADADGPRTAVVRAHGSRWGVAPAGR